MKQSFHFLLIAAISLLYTFHLSAQTQVRGRILEVAGAPLVFANILLLDTADSSFVKGEISDEDGTFTFAGLSQGSYRCEVSMVGYAKLSVVFQLAEQPGVLSLGDIVMDGGNDLAEVEVAAEKALLEVRADMLVFNFYTGQLPAVPQRPVAQLRERAHPGFPRTFPLGGRSPG